jgi:sulfur carrier protein
MTTTIEVTVNGQAREVPDGTSVGELIAMVTSLPSGIAAAVNGEILPRSAWAATLVAGGDLVEVVTAVQGG